MKQLDGLSIATETTISDAPELEQPKRYSVDELRVTDLELLQETVKPEGGASGEVARRRGAGADGGD